MSIRGRERKTYTDRLAWERSADAVKARAQSEGGDQKGMWNGKFSVQIPKTYKYMYGGSRFICSIFSIFTTPSTHHLCSFSLRFFFFFFLFQVLLRISLVLHIHFQK